MQYEEHHIVELTSPDGTVAVEQYDDPAEAFRVYGHASRSLVRGAKVKLHRYSTVVLASSVRAK
jgi:hypothetical protein